MTWEYIIDSNICILYLIPTAHYGVELHTTSVTDRARCVCVKTKWFWLALGLDGWLVGRNRIRIIIIIIIINLLREEVNVFDRKSGLLILCFLRSFWIDFTLKLKKVIELTNYLKMLYKTKYYILLNENARL